MLRSRKKAIFGWIGLVTAGFAVAIGGPYLVDFLKRDTLQKYRFQEDLQSQEESLSIKDATLRHYDKGSLVHKVKVQDFTVSQDRRVTRFRNAQEGQIQVEGMSPVQYSAQFAEWDDFMKELRAEGKIKVRSNDFALNTQQIEFQHATKKLEIKTPIVGSLYGGAIKAAKFTAFLDRKKYFAQNVAWQGIPKVEVLGAQPGKWNVKSSSFTSVDDTTVEYVALTANDGEIAFKAKRGVWNRKLDVFVATGDVQYFSKDANVLCDKVTIFRKERRAVLEGKVTMLIKPEDQQKLEIVELAPMRPIVPEEISKSRPAAPAPEDREGRDEVRSGSNVRRYPVRITATKVEYIYAEGKKFAKVTGAPQARQDLGDGRWRHAWSYRAEWNGETDILQLFSETNRKSVRFMTSIGDDIRARSASFSTQEGVERYSVVEPEGVLVGEEDDEIPRPNPGAGDGTNPPPPSGQLL